MCLLAIFVYLLWRKIYWNLLPVCKLGCFAVFLSCTRSLHILDTRPWFVNIFSCSVGWLFTFLIVTWRTKVHKLKSPPYLFFFRLVAYAFSVSQLRNIAYSEVMNFLHLHFLLGVLYLELLCLGLWNLSSSFLYIVWGRSKLYFFRTVWDL